MKREKDNNFDDLERQNKANDVFLANKRLNRRELSEKKFVLESKPIRLGIVVTNRCNLNCIMCPAVRKNGKNTLSKRALVNIYELLPYLERIDWQGGEIFLIDYLKDVFRDMQGYPNIIHQITTNGLLLDEEWISLLLNLNVRFIFSIDSVMPEKYEYIRRGARFGDLILKIELLNTIEQRLQKKFNKEISVVVMRSNFNELELFIDFAREYHFNIIEFYPVCHINSDENIFKNMTPDTRLVLKTKIENIKRLGRESNISINDRLPTTYSMDTPYFVTDGSKSERLFCSLPWTSLWIDAWRNGDITPHCMCEKALGNINNDSILKFWNNHGMIIYRRNMLYNNLNLCSEDCISGMTDSNILNVYSDSF